MTTNLTPLRSAYRMVSNFNYFCAFTRLIGWGQGNIMDLIRRSLLTFASLVILISCDVNNIDNIGKRRISKFEHEGHSYLLFRNIKDDQILHDPDCKCKDKGEK